MARRNWSECKKNLIFFFLLTGNLLFPTPSVKNNPNFFSKPFFQVSQPNLSFAPRTLENEAIGGKEASFDGAHSYAAGRYFEFLANAFNANNYQEISPEEPRMHQK